eukprot:gene16977-17164_t
MISMSLGNFQRFLGLLHMNSREIIKAIKAAGWQHVATSGDHWQFKHPTRPGRVTH